MEQQEEDPVDILREECLDWSEKKIQEAKETLDKYLEIVLQVYERIQKDPKLQAEFQAYLEKERGEGRKDY